MPLRSTKTTSDVQIFDSEAQVDQFQKDANRGAKSHELSRSLFRPTDIFAPEMTDQERAREIYPTFSLKMD